MVKTRRFSQSIRSRFEIAILNVANMDVGLGQLSKFTLLPLRASTSKAELDLERHGVRRFEVQHDPRWSRVQLPSRDNYPIILNLEPLITPTVSKKSELSPTPSHTQSLLSPLTLHHCQALWPSLRSGFTLALIGRIPIPRPRPSTVLGVSLQRITHIARICTIL